jgi:O-antigen/teichoic acid export membrane protein
MADDAGPDLVDPGAFRNTLLQLANQVGSGLFTATLTLYLVRALGASGYGLYALAVSIAGLLALPAGFGLPMAIGRFLADHRVDRSQLRAILALGLRLQVPLAVAVSVGLFAAAEPLAHAYHDPGLAWPLRWAALAIVGQTLFGFLSYACMSIRRVAVSLYMGIIESATETLTSVTLVLAGAGAAGATLGKAIGYGVASAAGLYLTLRLLGGLRRGVAVSPSVGARTIIAYAGATFIVDVGISAISQVDILLIGALLSSAAVGSFSAVVRMLAVLSYLGVAVAGGVAPRLSLGSGAPDARAFGQGIRYLLILQGMVIAPLVVWAKPIIDLVLGPGYGRSVAILQVLTLGMFVAAPAALLSLSVTYLGEARRRVRIVLWTLLLGIVVTYALIRTVGLVGAAIGDDIVEIAYISANLWICTRLITVDLRRLGWCVVRTLLAAAAMAVPLLLLGTNHLGLVEWIAGLLAGGAAFVATLLITRETSIAELRWIGVRLLLEVRPKSRSALSAEEDGVVGGDGG